MTGDIDRMNDQLDVLFRDRGMGQDPEPMDERVREERKRYTTQLQRRAQAHVTAELGGGDVMPDIDRQVTSVLQHAQDATKARRVTFYRPIVRGRRWHVAMSCCATVSAMPPLPTRAAAAGSTVRC